MNVLASEATGWERVRLRQQDRMRDAILQLVSEPGSPLTIANVCARADVSRPTFYKYFPTLGAAMLHVFTWVMDELAEDTQLPDTAGLTGLEIYLARARSAFNASCSRPELTRFISYLDYTFRATGMTLAESAAIEAIALRAKDRETQIVRAGQLDGSIRTDLTANDIVATVGSSLLGLRQRIQITDAFRADGAALGRKVYDIELSAWHGFLATPGSTERNKSGNGEQRRCELTE